MVGGFCGAAQAQRTAENAVAEAEDAFGTTVGSEAVGLYTSSNARGFNPTQAGNLRIDGLYFDQAANLNPRLVRRSSIHVGISAQGYPFPAPTGIADFQLRVPGNRPLTSVIATFGALLSYERYSLEVDTQMPLVADKLSIGGGFTFNRNNAHQVAIRDASYNGAIVAHWTPSDAASMTAFWSGLKTGAVGGDRPRIFVGNNPAPRFRPEDMGGPDWIYFGFRQYNYGGYGSYQLANDWTVRAGLFRSVNNVPRSFTAFLLNTNEAGEGDYAIEQGPPRHTRSVSGEVRVDKLFVDGPRRHNLLFMARGRDRDVSFGGGDVRLYGRATLGAIPTPPEPQFQTTALTRTEARQFTGGVGYEGIWRGVGQLTAGVQKSDYERSLFRPGAAEVAGGRAPWLYNAGLAAYLSPELALYASYTRDLEELGTAPGNAVNRDEAVPAQVTRQFDAGFRYNLRPGLQLVTGVFQIDKPYYGLDTANVFRALGDIRHRGVEVSLAGPLTDTLTVVAGAVFLQPRILDTTRAGGTTLTAVGPVPRLLRMNLQYSPPGIAGLLLDAKVESVSSRYLTVANVHRIGGAVTIDAGVRYTRNIAGNPVRFRLQGLNLTNTFSVTPNLSGQIAPFEKRRVELSIAADF